MQTQLRYKQTYGLCVKIRGFSVQRIPSFSYAKNAFISEDFCWSDSQFVGEGAMKIEERRKAPSCAFCSLVRNSSLLPSSTFLSILKFFPCSEEQSSRYFLNKCSGILTLSYMFGMLVVGMLVLENGEQIKISKRISKRIVKGFENVISKGMKKICRVENLPIMSNKSLRL